MIQTFADTFQPRAIPRVRQAMDARAFERKIGPLVAPIGQEFDTRAMQKAAEQVKHFRLWNYIAVHKNSEKASETFPQIGVLRRGSRTRTTAPAQRLHLQRYYGLNLANDDDLTPAPESHPFNELLHRVNPQDWWQSFGYETHMMLGLTGAFAWWAIPNGISTANAPGGLPSELWVIPTQWLKPLFRKSGELRAWMIEPHGDYYRRIELPPDEVIYGPRKNPRDKINPWSPTQAGAEWVQNAEDIERARHLTYKHGPLQTMSLEFDPEHHSDPNYELLDAVAEKFLQRYGGVEKSYKPIAQPPGVKAVPLSLKPSEMILPEMEEQARDQILALHGTPKAITGLSQDLNKASIYGANLIWCSHTIMPLQAFLAGCMTEKLARRYDDRLVVWFPDCSPNDDEAERAEWELDFKMGAAGPNDRRMHRGMDPLPNPGADKTYLPATVSPVEDFDESTEDRREAELGPMMEETDAGPPEDQSFATCVHGHRFAVGGGAQPVSQASKKATRIGRAFGQLHKAHERNVVGTLTRFWRRLGRGVLKRFDQGSTDRTPPLADDLLPRAEFRDAFNRVMSPRWREMARTGAAFELDLLGLQQSRVHQRELPDIDIELSPALRRSIEAFLRDRLEGVWGQVHRTVHEKLEEELRKGLEAGESVREMRKRVQTLIVEQYKHQARTIARTEATASLNFGQQALRQSEGVPRKQWIATLDVRTRPEHGSADLQIVPTSQPFVVGGERLMHPGDGSLGASASNLVNCRCSSAGVVDLE